MTMKLSKTAMEFRVDEWPSNSPPSQQKYTRTHTNIQTNYSYQKILLIKQTKNQTVKKWYQQTHKSKFKHESNIFTSFLQIIKKTRTRQDKHFR